jgi:hypothetical protein
MTSTSIADGKLVVEVHGWDKLWALRSRLEIPVEHVSKVCVDPSISDAWWKGLRVGGTHLPGVITAGTFYHHGDWVFWDVHNFANAIVIELRDECYARLIVEVEDPAATVSLLQAALPTPQASLRPCN